MKKAEDAKCASPSTLGDTMYSDVSHFLQQVCPEVSESKGDEKKKSVLR